MRGRTNITQRSGTVPVNGDIIEAEVSGGNIDPGDFVKYQTIESSKDLMNLTSSDYFKDYIEYGENYYICLITNSLYLFKINGDDIDIVATYNDYLINCFTLLDDNSIACSIQSDPYVIRISVMDEGFVLLNSAKNGVSLTTNFCFYYQNFLCFVKDYDDANLSIYYYKVNELYEIEYINYINKSLSGYGDSGYAYAFENGNLCFLKQVSSSSSGTKYSYIYNVSVKFEGDMISLETIFRTKTSYWALYNVTPNIFYGKYYVVFGNFASSQSTSVYDRQCFIFNINSGSVSYIKLSTLGILNSSDNSNLAIKTSKIINGSKLIIYAASGRTGVESNICILELSEETGSLSVISNIFAVDYKRATYAFIFFNNYLIRFICKNNENYKIICYNYEVNNSMEIISGKINKNVVSPWVVGSLGIGFAKTGGTPGETIQVYVPKSN